MTIIEAQRKTAQILRAGGVENAMNEARFLLEDALGMDNVQLVTGYRDHACEACVETAFGWAARRAAGEPLQYILGHTDFMGLDMKAAPAALIPRPETEGLCELLAEEAKERTAGCDAGASQSKTVPWPARVLDLCTGSGCIAAWAAHTFAGASVTAADLSEEALAIAAENCKAHETYPGQIVLKRGDLFEALGDGDGSLSHVAGTKNRPRFDVIISNPPYIPSATVDSLETEVKDHEPRLALDGGPEGMDAVGRIIAQAPSYLVPGGLLLMEIDDTQEELVLAACKQSGKWSKYEVLHDLSGKARYLRAFV